MTDYNKMTVANLRALMKDRGIPSTGLTRKAQIIEKLQEEDGRENEKTEALSPDATASEPEKQEDVDAGEDEAATTREVTDTVAVTDTVTETPRDKPAAKNEEVTSIAPEGDATVKETSGEDHRPAEPDSVDVSTASLCPFSPHPAPPHPPNPNLEQEAQPTIQAVDFAMPAKTPSPAPNEQPSVEQSVVAMDTSPEQPADTASEGGQSAADSIAPSRIDSEELEADTRKRKRRSTSPVPPIEDIKAKKMRPSDEVAPEVHLKEDGDIVMEQAIPLDDGAVENKVTQDELTEHRDQEEAQKEDNESEFAATSVDASDVRDLPVPTDSPSRRSSRRDSRPTALDFDSELEKSSSERKEKENRYKDIFSPAAAAPPQSASNDRDVEPSLHPATPALYIRNFMRPLKDQTLRNYVVVHAAEPGRDPDNTVVQSLFLDQMRTHALVRFASTAAACRVRAVLHKAVWPEEKNRKELWVDFVPDNKVDSWIKTEKDYEKAEKEGRITKKPITSATYEVVYPESPTTGTVEAVFREVCHKPAPPPFNPPTGPKSAIEKRRPSTQSNLPPAAINPDLSKSFLTLAQMFKETEAKPKLFWQPVSEKRANDRLDDLDYETSRDWSPNERIRGRNAPIDRKFRYSFDDDDRVIEFGDDRGPWAADSVVQGGGGGGYRGRGGGGFRSDRGYRGHGGGFRGGRGGGFWRG